MDQELKELLKNPPSEEYLDKLIEAAKLWSNLVDEVDEELLNKILALPDINDLIDLQSQISEDYLDKLILAGKVSFDD